MRQGLLALAELGCQDGGAAFVAVQLAAKRRFGRLDLDRLFVCDVPAAGRDAGALHRQIGQHRELAQLDLVTQPQGFCHAIRVVFGHQLAAIHPQLGVERSARSRKKARSL